MSHPTLPQLPQKLTALVQALRPNLSTRALAQEINIDDSRIYTWLRGACEPRLVHLVKLVEIARRHGLDASWDDLLGTKERREELSLSPCSQACLLTTPSLTSCSCPAAALRDAADTLLPHDFDHAARLYGRALYLETSPNE